MKIHLRTDTELTQLPGVGSGLTVIDFPGVSGGKFYRSNVGKSGVLHCLPAERSLSIDRDPANQLVPGPCIRGAHRAAPAVTGANKMALMVPPPSLITVYMK